MILFLETKKEFSVLRLLTVANIVVKVKVNYSSLSKNEESEKYFVQFQCCLIEYEVHGSYLYVVCGV